MQRVLLFIVIGMLTTLGVVPVPAGAQSTVQYRTTINNRVPQVTYTLQGIYWPTNSEFVTLLSSNGGTILNWNTAMYGLDFRVDTRSHWGVHLNGMTGNQNSWQFLGMPVTGLSLSGTDTIWSADVSYLWQQPLPDNPSLVSTFRGFVGWGDAKASTTIGNLQSLGFAFNSATVSEESSGLRVGFDATYPFQSGWSLNGGVAYYPSTNTTGTVVAPGVGSASTNVAGTGWDASGGIRYTFTGQWNVELGYRWVRQYQNAASVSGVAVCPCHTQWEGPYVALGVGF